MRSLKAKMASAATATPTPHAGSTKVNKATQTTSWMIITIASKIIRGIVTAQKVAEGPLAMQEESVTHGG